MNVLFVCASNTCRSPAAEHFAVDWLTRHTKLTRQQQEAKGIHIHSAALTDAFEKPDSPASENVIRIMHEYLIDLSAHRSKLLTAEMIKQADVVVCLSSGHRDMVLNRFPLVAKQTRLTTLARDVPDPFHMDYETYMETMALVEELVREFMEKTFTW